MLLGVRLYHDMTVIESVRVILRSRVSLSLASSWVDLLLYLRFPRLCAHFVFQNLVYGLPASNMSCEIAVHAEQVAVSRGIVCS